MITKFNLLSNSPEEILNYVDGDYSGFNTKEDAIDEIDYLINSDFPNGLKNIPNTVILYRVLLLDDELDLDEQNLGIHFTSYPKMDRGFLEKIGIWDNWYPDESTLYLLECETNKKNINIEETISNRVSYPREEEFTTYYDAKIKIINKSIIHKEDIKIL